MTDRRVRRKFAFRRFDIIPRDTAIRLQIPDTPDIAIYSETSALQMITEIVNHSYQIDTGSTPFAGVFMRLKGSAPNEIDFFIPATRNFRPLVLTHPAVKCIMPKSLLFRPIIFNNNNTATLWSARTVSPRSFVSARRPPPNGHISPTDISPVHTAVCKFIECKLHTTGHGWCSLLQSIKTALSTQDQSITAAKSRIDRNADILAQFDSSLFSSFYNSMVTDILSSASYTAAFLDIGGVIVSASLTSMAQVWSHGIQCLTDAKLVRVFDHCTRASESIVTPWRARRISMEKEYAVSDALLYVSTHAESIVVLSCWTNTCSAPLSSKGVEKTIIDAVKHHLPDSGYVYLLFPIKFPGFRQRRRGIFMSNPGIVIVWNADCAALGEIASMLEECVMSKSTLVLISDTDSTSCVALMCRDTCILSNRLQNRTEKVFLPDKFVRKSRPYSKRFMIPPQSTVMPFSGTYDKSTIEKFTSV